MNWQERIIERFKEEFGDKIHQLVMLDHEGSKPVGTAREIADLYSQEIDEFLLQEGEKIRREAIEEVKEEVKEKLERVTSLIASSPYYPGGVVWCCKPEIYEVLDKLKSDSEEEYGENNISGRYNSYSPTLTAERLNTLRSEANWCKPGEHRFVMDSAPVYFCHKCGMGSDEYDFDKRRC